MRVYVCTRPESAIAVAGHPTSASAFSRARLFHHILKYLVPITLAKTRCLANKHHKI